MTSFDRAWDIAKEDDPDYSKFGEKFARKIMDMKEGAKGLPEGTKFSDLRSTSPPSYMNVDRYQPKSVVPDIMDLLSGAGSEREVEPFGGSELAMRPTSGKFMNDYEPINILDLGPSRMMPEEPNMKILREIMGQDTSDDAIDEMERIREQRDRMAAESAKMRGHVNIPDSLIRRVRDDPTPKDD